MKEILDLIEGYGLPLVLLLGALYALYRFLVFSLYEVKNQFSRHHEKAADNINEMISKNLEISIGNIIWIVGIIFTMGIAYSQIGQIEEDVIVLEQRLEKKIKIINEFDDKINKLEIELAKLNGCK